MGLKERLQDDLKDAMRAGEATRRETLRSVLTAINNAAIARVDVKDESATRQELPDTDIIVVLQKQAKQRRESIEEYKKAGRNELADREQAELAIIEAYLPQQLSREEITVAVQKAIAEVGASGPSDKAKLMPVVMGRLKGQADGRLINDVVTELLKGG